MVINGTPIVISNLVIYHKIRAMYLGVIFSDGSCYLAKHLANKIKELNKLSSL